MGKHRTQRVVIYYRVVGYLEIPEEATRFSEDTRQGVSVEVGVPRKRVCEFLGVPEFISCAPIKVHYGDDREECEEGG
ncbi:MAG: hypothetical protein J6X34_05345 [Clostridia bacterium]|nr:hypothetical protein [Clostridia bacterium]